MLPYVPELSYQQNAPMDEMIIVAMTKNPGAEIIAKETAPRGMSLNSLAQPDSLSTTAKAIAKVDDLPKVKRLLPEDTSRRSLEVVEDEDAESSLAKQARDEKVTPPGSQPKPTAEPLAVSSKSNPKPLQLDEDAPKEPPGGHWR
jgi:hypothetical protein